MSRVYSLKTVSTSDGRCMGVCFSISEEKRCNREGKKTYFGGLLSRFSETQNRLVLLERFYVTTFCKDSFFSFDAWDKVPSYTMIVRSCV